MKIKMILTAALLALGVTTQAQISGPPLTIMNTNTAHLQWDAVPNTPQMTVSHYEVALTNSAGVFTKTVTNATQVLLKDISPTVELPRGNYAAGVRTWSTANLSSLWTNATARFEFIPSSPTRFKFEGTLTGTLTFQ